MGKTSPFFFYFLSIAMVLSSCEKTDDDAINKAENSLSIEAYIYVGEPVKCIKLNKISDQNSFSFSPLATANVELRQHNQLINFHSVDSIPGTYTQTDSSVSINAGSPVHLNIESGEKSYRLKAKIPPKIQNLVIDDTEITLDSSNPDEVICSISWEAIEGYSYCIFIRNEGNDYFPIPDYEGTHSQSAFYSLIIENRVELKSRDFTNQGHFDIYITAVDAAYANFYTNPANIAHLTELNSGLPAWGVFTVFNGSSIPVHVN